MHRPMDFSRSGPYFGGLFIVALVAFWSPNLWLSAPGGCPCTACSDLALMLLGFQQYYLHGKKPDGADLPVSMRTSSLLHGSVIVMQGQACAYMIGQLRILELREKAKKKLGAKFDIKQFHNTVLSVGCVPLDVLEKEVEAWTTAQKQRQ